MQIYADYEWKVWHDRGWTPNKLKENTIKFCQKCKMMQIYADYEWKVWLDGGGMPNA